MTFLALLGLVSPLLAQDLLTRKINAPLAPIPASRVGEAAFSPDEARVVFTADLDFDEEWSLYAVPADGSLDAVQLDDEESRASTSDLPFAITADSQRVVWIGDGRIAHVRELFSAPLDGSEPGVRLHALLPEDLDVIDFALSPDSTRVAFVLEGPTQYLLLANEVDGGQADVLGVLSKLGSSAGLAIDASSTRVVFAAGNLYSVRLDGSSAAITLSNSSSGGAAVGFELTPDGSRVLFGKVSAGNVRLYSVPAAGGVAPVQIEPEPLGTTFTRLLITPDSTQLAFRTSTPRLMSAPCDGSAPALELARNGLYRNYTLTSDGRSVVYQQGNQILRRALDGSDAPLRIDGPGAAVVGDFKAGRDELVYINPNERLFGAAYDGSGGLLLEGGPANELDDYLIQAQGGLVAFARHGVWRVPALDPSVLFVLDPRDEVFDLLSMSTGATGSVLYRRGGEVQELWAARLDATTPPLQLSPPIIGTRLTGDVATYEVSWPYVVYEEISGSFPYRLRLMVARLDQRTMAVERVPEGVLKQPALGTHSKSWWISGANLVFVGRLPGDADQRLCRVPLDGSLPMQSISGSRTFNSSSIRVQPADSSATRFLFQPDGSRLYSVPGDGSAAPVLIGNVNVSTFAATEDGNSAVFVEFNTQATWFAPVDGSAPASLLVASHPQYLSDRRLGGYWVYYRDEDFDGLYELHMVELASGVDRSYHEASFFLSVLLSGDRVLFDASHPGTSYELFSAPLDASAPAIRLSGTLVPGRGVNGANLVLDDGTVIYSANQDVDMQYELYRVPVDGSQAPTRLIASMPAGSNVGSFLVSSNQESLAVMLRTATGGYLPFGLPAAGGSLAALGQPSVPGVSVGGSLVPPDSNDLVFTMDRELSGRIELYRQPLDAHLPPQRLSIPLVESGDVAGLFGFHVWPLPQGLLYVADAERDGLVELYFVRPTSEPPGSMQSSPTPTRTVTRTH